MEVGSAASAVQQRRPRVAVCMTPGIGHLIPIMELAKVLIDRHGFSVTIITLAFSASATQSSILSSLPSDHFSHISLPPVPLDDLPDDVRIETTMSEATVRSLPALRHALSALPDVVVFISDLFSTDTFSVASQLGLPHYLFFPTNLLALSLILHLPAIEAAATDHDHHLPDPLRLPGCFPIPRPDILHPIQDRSNDAYRWFVHHGRRYREAQGILVNSFDAIEPGAAAALCEAEPGRPPVYLVGPLTRKPEKSGDEEAECLRWLDRQPPRSVLYVSFGSGGTLPKAQLAELALGLEMSGQRFLWVVRSPSDGEENSEAFFTVQSKADPFRFLPNGFAERTQDVGLLIPSWAPQTAVLHHPATGGILSHCGWNSTLESVVAGVAMAAWPLFAEQRQNAVMLAAGAGIALLAKAGEGGLVPREEVARVVREMIEGEEGKAARRQVEVLREKALNNLKVGGAAEKALDDVVKEWKR
ncbi:hydroquinone glucosyltransferase-like [Zingiber officinale]|uniref:Uncharacterized protein n=1 Tax=Zingiber officinale TaxID=94328 RepID=A0A8J5LSL2_ZINOF|nr:hydroquinone glucosyltransferase-like [Zingiber officinale]KAG6529023.1 hypothetical protein ZIOFF_011215 [Zingiber officinale]